MTRRGTLDPVPPCSVRMPQATRAVACVDASQSIFSALFIVTLNHHRHRLLLGTSLANTSLSLGSRLSHATELRMVFFMIFSSTALAGMMHINLGGSMFADEGEGTGLVTTHALETSIGNHGDPLQTSCPGLKDADHSGRKEDLLCDTGTIHRGFASLPPHGSAFLHAPKDGMFGLLISNFVWALCPALTTAFKPIEVNKTTIRSSKGCQEFAPLLTCAGRGECVELSEQETDHSGRGGAPGQVCKCTHSHGFDFPSPQPRKHPFIAFMGWFEINVVAVCRPQPLLAHWWPRSMATPWNTVDWVGARVAHDVV